VPVGLSFEARKKFRGRVLVSFGEPVDVSSYLAVYRGAERRQIVEELERATRDYLGRHDTVTTPVSDARA